MKNILVCKTCWISCEIETSCSLDEMSYGSGVTRTLKGDEQKQNVKNQVYLVLGIGIVATAACCVSGMLGIASI